MKTNKFLNVKVSVDLFNLLNTKEIFKSNWKSIPPCISFMNLLSIYMETWGFNEIEFSSYRLIDLFKPYTKGVYRPYLESLQELGLITINESYSVNNEQCKKYTVTESGIKFLVDSNIEYLKKLHNDPTLIRNNQKTSNKRINNTNYNDYIFNYISDLLNTVKYDYNQTQEILNKPNWNNGKETTNLSKNHAINRLTNFKERKFRTIQHNINSDNRIWNEFVGIKSDLRKCFSYKDMKYNKVVDIRSCHPTFFSFYILINFIKLQDIKESTNSNSLNSNKLISPLSNFKELIHIDVMDNGDIQNIITQNPNKSEGYNLDTIKNLEDKMSIKDILKEHLKWVKIFTNKEMPPKRYIMEQCGYTTEDQAKNALNETINGSFRYGKLIKWMEKEFPLICKTWKEIGVNRTEEGIGANFETVLMLDEEIFKYADDMGIKLSYEYDGYGIFHRDDDKDINEKIQFIINYITSKSKTLWNIPVVIVAKDVN